MQQKLIITLWKAQFQPQYSAQSVYCRLAYKNTQRKSKSTNQLNNYTWKQTFIFPLAKEEQNLVLDFISLKEGQQIHFVKQQVAESLSFGRSTIPIVLQGSHRGSLPCKVDIISKNKQNIGKIFIQYEIMKTQIAYTVQKQMDYIYLLKLSNFKVNFVRKIKDHPIFFLSFLVQGKQHRQALPFQHEQGWVYNYPVKLYLKKQMQVELILNIKDNNISYDNQSVSSYTESIVTQKKTNQSSIRKQKMLLQLGKQKISTLLELGFKKDVKINKKLPLTTLVKGQKRQIGTIQFNLQTVFRSKQQLQQLQQQKKGLNPQPIKIQKKKSIIKQSNGTITVNSILGRLQLFNDAILQGKDMSIQLKLGKQVQQSSILQHPGKQLIFIDTFLFYRTWQQTFKITIYLHSKGDKSPTFFGQLSLRQLLQIGRYVSKKTKLKDQNRHYSGQLTFDVVYKQVQQKKAAPSPSPPPSQVPLQQESTLKLKSKRLQIEQRMKKKAQQKQASKQLSSLSTIAVLRDNDIILPPLRSISRIQTLSPRQQKTKGANVFNVNGSIKFSKSPRFQSSEHYGYESYTYNRQSDFDISKKKGSSIGKGSKIDFVKPLALNPGVGRYQIPSLWDKYC